MRKETSFAPKVNKFFCSRPEIGFLYFECLTFKTHLTLFPRRRHPCLGTACPGCHAHPTPAGAQQNRYGPQEAEQVRGGYVRLGCTQRNK